MHKFSDMKQLVEDHLDGQLERLRVEYEDDTHMLMEFSYVGKDAYYMYYDILVNASEQTVSFKECFCIYGRSQIKVKRRPKFDHAVEHYLFST